MDTESGVVEAVGEVYRGLDSRIEESGFRCEACGKCCDFDAFGHRLFVTSAEMEYFVHHMSADAVKRMGGGVCPYNRGGKCTVYRHRFAACRIFNCKGDSDLQSALSETSLDRLKYICNQFGIPYRYTDLRTALNEFCASRDSEWRVPRTNPSGG